MPTLVWFRAVLQNRIENPALPEKAGLMVMRFFPKLKSLYRSLC